MRASRKGTETTRTNLLTSASTVFAEKSYRDATVAEICTRAGANVAAVNYYFGSKENLYREAWRHAFRQSIAAHPPDGGVSDEAPAQERLCARVLALLQRIADEKSVDFLIVHRELGNPTGLLQELMRKEVWPLHQKMESIIRELIGPEAPRARVELCAMSVVSLCITPMLVRRMEKKEHMRGGDFPRIDNIEAYADHVVKFSLAGIRAYRSDTERGSKNLSDRTGGNP